MNRPDLFNSLKVSAEDILEHILQEQVPGSALIKMVGNRRGIYLYFHLCVLQCRTVMGSVYE